MPMAFAEIDEARKQAATTGVSDKRGKKRKNATIARLTSNGVVDETGMINSSSSASVSSQLANGVGNSSSTSEVNDLRTGRWTTEETEYCDSLIRAFEQGMLPLTDGVKLNDFLSSMLKSKQSRLTKKMKNAHLSSRQYRLNLGHIPTKQEATDFSRKETEFFASIKCPMERSEIRFHMQKEWREMFSSYCAAIGQSLDGMLNRPSWSTILFLILTFYISLLLFFIFSWGLAVFRGGTRSSTIHAKRCCSDGPPQAHDGQSAQQRFFQQHAAWGLH